MPACVFLFEVKCPMLSWPFAFALSFEVGCSGHIHGIFFCQEISRNVDTLALAPPKGVPTIAMPREVDGKGKTLDPQVILAILPSACLGKALLWEREKSFFPPTTGWPEVIGDGIRLTDRG